MLTYCVTKMITTCSPMTGQFFDTMIVSSSDKSGYNDPSRSKCELIVNYIIVNRGEWL